MKHNYFLRDIQDENERKGAQKKLAQVVEYAELRTCRRAYLLGYFSEKQEAEGCGGCDVCLRPKEEVDATIISQKILSAIVRTGERFGGRYVMSVLRGSRVKKVLEFGHDQLSVFGIAKDSSEEEIMYFINLLIAKGYAAKSEGEYPMIYLTNLGKKFLNNREKIFLLSPQFEKESELEVKKKKGALEYDTQLFEQLRAIRKSLAEQKGVPPFIVFSDVALQEMAYYFPQNKESFLQISGVGAMKLSEYGEKFMGVIGDYAKKNNLVEKQNISHRDAPSLRLKNNRNQDKEVLARRIHGGAGSTYMETKERLNAGMSLGRIASERKLSLVTIIAHIEKLKESGEEIEIEHLRLPEKRFQEIKVAFEKSGGALLSPVLNILGEDYSYEELRVARLFL